MIEGRVSLQNILNIVPEIDLFRYYIGKFTVGEAIKSPLRNDNNPSFVVYTNKSGKLKWKDFGTGDGGSIIDFIMKRFGCSFSEVLNIINNDFKLCTERSINLPMMMIGLPQKVVNTTTKIIPTVRDWNVEDKKYWSKYGINRNILRLFNVFPVSSIRVEKGDNVKIIEFSQPTYGYYLGVEQGIRRYKTYTPNAYDRNHKWKSNTTKNTIQGIDNLRFKSDKLIVTKSLKDVMVLYVLGYEAIAPVDETIKEIDKLREFKSKFNSIFTLMDNDETGVKCGERLKAKHDTIPLLIPKEKAKDISDYVSIYGLKEGEKLIKLLIDERK